MNEKSGNKLFPKSEAEPVITRVFYAPRKAVWRAWTDPQALMSWWGPKGFTSPVAKIDFRVGGKYLNCMRSPEGKDYWSTGVYKEIVPMERIVVTYSFADKDGNIVPASYYGMSSDFPLEMTIVIMFEEQDGKTKLTLKYPNLDTLNSTDRMNMEQGWNESFDKLQEVLKKPEISPIPTR